MSGLTNAGSTAERTAAATTLESWGCNKQASCLWEVSAVESTDSS